MALLYNKPIHPLLIYTVLTITNVYLLTICILVCILLNHCSLLYTCTYINAYYIQERKEGRKGTGARVCTSTRRESTSLYEYHPTGKEIWKARVPEGRVRVGTKGVRVCTSTTPAFPKAKGKARVRGGKVREEGYGRVRVKWVP